MGLNDPVAQAAVAANSKLVYLLVSQMFETYQDANTFLKNYPMLLLALLTGDWALGEQIANDATTASALTVQQQNVFLLFSAQVKGSLR